MTLVPLAPPSSSTLPCILIHAPRHPELTALQIMGWPSVHPGGK